MKKTDHVVAQDDDGIRLDRWFKRHQPGLTHALLQKLLRKGDVRLDGKKADASARLAAGQVIGLRFEGKITNITQAPRPSHRPVVTPEQVEMLQKRVLYKDANVLVINKPAGLAVQGGTGQATSVDAMLDGLMFDAKSRPKLVHRLDIDTSGVLVLARSAKAAGELSKAFAGKGAQKTYWALVIGAPELTQGEIDAPLGKVLQGKDSRMGMMEQRDGRRKMRPRAMDKRDIAPKTREEEYEKMGVDEAGKHAVTQYRVIERLGDRFSWVELMPITGRTHQLRVHMAAIGHPIVGDGKYGGRDAFIRGMEISNKLHLHARRIVVNVMGKKIDVSAPLPEHMQESWDSLGLDE